MGEPSRWSNPKRRRAATVSIGDGDGGGVDLISGLSDDLLLRILDLVPKAKNVVRTHALSRRWRGLWTGVTALRFDFSSSTMLREPCKSDADARRYIDFVNGALALRATAAKEPAFVEDLAICFDIDGLSEQLVPPSVEAVQGWIRYAVQHGVKSLTLTLMLPWRRSIEVEHPVMTLNEMDSYAKMETMLLRLYGAELQLPSCPVVFSSLTDLSLECIMIPAGGVHLLSRLLSPTCCPRLHKLRIDTVGFRRSRMELLRIEVHTLLELSIKTIVGPKFLELRTRSLRVLCVEDCSDLDVFMVSAPRLDLICMGKQPFRRIVDVHDHLSSVGNLKIQLSSRGVTEDMNDGSIHLLQCCRSTSLQVSFDVPEAHYHTVDIIKGKIPLLSHVTRLAVHIELWEQHSTGPGVACLLAQCHNIKYLSLQLHTYLLHRNQSEWDLCNNDSCHWKSHEFFLAHLQEVEFKKVMGSDCEFQFIQSILTKAIGIQKVTISLNQRPLLEVRKDAFKLMPPLDGGMWTEDANLSYKWRRCL